MRKIIIFGALFAIIISMLAGNSVVLAKANDNNGSAYSLSNADLQGKFQIIKRLILIQDQAKVSAFLDKQVKNGKLNQDQADKIMTFWQNNHVKAAEMAKRLWLRNHNK